LTDRSGELDATISHPNFRTLVETLAPYLTGAGQPEGRFSVHGKLSLQGERIEIFDLDGDVGGQAIGGGGQIALESNRLKLALLLDAGRLPLTWAIIPAAFGMATNGPLAGVGSRAGWPEEPFNPAGWSVLDIELGIDAEAFVADAIALENAHLDIAITGGAVHLRVIEGQYLGGTVSANGTFIPEPGGPATLTFRADLSDLDAGKIEAVDALKFDGGWLYDLLMPLIPRLGSVARTGSVDVGIELAAAGRSPAEMVESLSGLSLATFQNIELSAYDSCQIAGILARGPALPDEALPGSGSEPGPELVPPADPSVIVLDPFTFQISIEDGIGFLSGSEITQECARIVLDGEVDFPQRQVDFTARITLENVDDSTVELPIIEFSQTGPFGNIQTDLSNRDEILDFREARVAQLNSAAATDGETSDVTGEASDEAGGEVSDAVEALTSIPTPDPFLEFIDALTR
jgi:hypothetical protein